jgi:hypothetical protein
MWRGIWFKAHVINYLILTKNAFPRRGKVPEGRMGEYRINARKWRVVFFDSPHPLVGHLPPVGEGVRSNLLVNI